jgi:hypothetical protein
MNTCKVLKILFYFKIIPNLTDFNFVRKLFRQSFGDPRRTIFYFSDFTKWHTKIKVEKKKQKSKLKEIIIAQQHRPAPNSASGSSPGPSSGFREAEKKNRKGVKFTIKWIGSH